MYAALFFSGLCGVARAERPCARFGEPVVLGAFADPAITESSGLAVSPFQAGVRFTHNDSGDRARIFAFDALGTGLGEWAVAGADHRDWEDMAYGPCKEGLGCLFVADMGDNARVWETVTLYRTPEPMVGAQAELRSIALELTYPDGARDAEALLVDPQTSDLFIIEKADGISARVVVLRDAGQLAAGSYALESLGTVDGLSVLTGGDFGPTGDEAVIRGYGSDARRLLPRRDAAGRVISFDPLDGVTVDLIGEAIAYRSDGLALLTTREGQGAQLAETPCLAPQVMEPGPAVGPLVPLPEPTGGDGCGGDGQATLPTLLLFGLLRRKRRRLKFGPAAVGGFVLVALLSGANPAQAEVQHQLYAALAGGVWPSPQAGGHGVAVLQWRAQRAPGQGSFTLALNTDTLRLRYDDVCFGRVCVGAELAGEALFAGLLTDYYAGGQRVPELQLSASYVAASAFVELRPAARWFTRYTATGRKWFFSDFSEVQAGILPPADVWVAEQELSLTYWQFEPDPSQWQPHRLFMRLTGLGAGLQLSAHLRSDDTAWGQSSDPASDDRRNDPSQLILRVRQWARYGAQLHPRFRVQVEERFAWGRGEDDLTRDRIGGLNPYVTPVGGVPWAAFVSERYVSGRLSGHVRVAGEVEAGLFFDAVTMQGILRDASRRFGGAVGTGAFVDARLGDWQADLWLAWAPGLNWGADAHYVAAFFSVGYRII